MKSIVAVILTVTLLTAFEARTEGADGKILHSADGQYQLAVPDGWEAADFHVEAAQIQAANKHRGEYAELVSEDRQNYTNSLTQYAEAKRDTMAMSLDNPRLSSSELLKVNGLDGVRYQLHGELPNSNVSIAYSLTVIKTKTHYVQIIGWTPEARFSENRGELESLAAGFAENTDSQK